MKRSFTQRGTALALATVLNAAAVWLLAQQPAAGRGSFDLDTAGAARAEALAASAQSLSGGRGKSVDAPAERPAGAPAGAARPQAQALDGHCLSVCLPHRV